MGKIKKKKVSHRRQQVRNNIATERFGKLAAVVNSPYPLGVVFLLLFMAAVTITLGIDTAGEGFYLKGIKHLKPWYQLLSLGMVVGLVSLGGALYIHHYQPQIITRKSRMAAMGILFWLFLAITRLFSVFEGWSYLVVGTAVTCAIILTITYDQRFAVGMTGFYAVLACFAVRVDQQAPMFVFEIFLAMLAGTVSCCFSLHEIRTRKKLIEVSLLVTIVVFLTVTALEVIQGLPYKAYLYHAGLAAGSAFVAGIFIQAFLPIIEQAFGIATSMTLMDYSDANQPLLRKLAMDAPGTFSHSLLIGSIAESAAEAIGANGLLCRVGSYYHDIGKISKAAYFVENQMGSASRHEQLSPAMSQLVIAGHVKDGIEIAKEFGLPAVLRQFIETHHGTTLMEYFYHEARKKQDDRQTAVSEAEFRYPGPKPRTKEAAIVMLSDAAESAARSLTDHTHAKIETMIHTIAMKRLQDGQFDECDLTLRELSQIEMSLSKSLAAYHHGRIAYPKMDEKAKDDKSKADNNGASAADKDETDPPENPVRNHSVNQSYEPL